MDIYSLITKFWRKETSADENRKLLHDLKNDEPIRRAMEVEFYNNAETKVGSQERWKNVEQRIVDIPKPTSKLVSFKSWLYAAASVLIIVALGAVYMLVGTDSDNKAQLTTIKNEGFENKLLWLPDSTRVELYPGSYIQYDDSFNVVVRNVQLGGKGKFDVRRHAGKPFAVGTEKIITTVLGTSFTIDPIGDKIEVHLHEGRLLITSATPDIELGQVYMDGGDVFSIDSESKKYTVKNLRKQEKAPVAIAPVKKARSTQPAVIDFKKEELARVFDRLGEHYNIRIQYDREDIAGLKFTGSFSGKDRIETILTIVTSLNDLHFSSSGGAFVVQRIN